MIIILKHFLRMHIALMHSVNNTLNFMLVSNPICFTKLISYK